MSYSMRAVVEVLIEDDHETTIAFQEWALANRIPSTGSSSAFVTGLRYYFANEHAPAIRKWFSDRADDALGTICTSQGAGFTWRRP